MYIEFFKLDVLPFRSAIDLDFMYMSAAHARSKAYMDYAVLSREGFVVITGVAGAGKTALVHKLMSELDERTVVARIFQTQLDETEFLRAVLADFGVNLFHAGKAELIDALNTFLIDSFLQFKQPLLIVDDAHNLGVRALEEVRMLSELEAGGEKVLHVILVGQPCLEELLDAANLEQAAQRVRLRHQVKPLSEPETREYILHRLNAAGAENAEGVFAADTYPVIFSYSGGLPRLINTLCDTAMTCAFADNTTEVTMAVLNAAIEELQWDAYDERISRRRAPAMAGDERTMLELLRDNVRILDRISQQMGRLDALGASVNTVCSRLAGIETLAAGKSENVKEQQLP